MLDLCDLFAGELTEDQRRKLEAFRHAAEALGDLIHFGDLVITYHQNVPFEYGLGRKVRPIQTAASKK